MGPLLVFVVINYVETFVAVDMRFYADDCISFSEVRDVNDQRLLNRDLGRLSEWCTTSQLPFNVEKCVPMTFSRKLLPLTLSYQINNNPVQSVSTYKYLGVIFSADLKWNIHVDSVVCKAYGKLWYLRSNLKHSSYDIKTTVYKTLIRPVLEHTSEVWGPYTALDIDNLKKCYDSLYDSYTSGINKTILLRHSMGKLTLRFYLPGVAKRDSNT